MSNNELKKNKYAEYIRDFTALGNPFLLLLAAALVLCHLPDEQEWKAWALIITTFLINELVCSGIKFLWHKPRPSGQTFHTAMEKIDAGSFPSIHAARIMLVYGALAYVLWGAGLVYLLPICAVIIAVVGYSRVFLHKHFWLDVSAGFGFGAVWLIVMYFIWIMILGGQA